MLTNNFGRYVLLAAVAASTLAGTASAQDVSVGGQSFSSKSGTVSFKADKNPSWEATGTVKQRRLNGRISLVLTNFKITNKCPQKIRVNLCMTGLRFPKKAKVLARYWMKGTFRGANTGNSSVTMTGAVDGIPIPPIGMTANRDTSDTINEASPPQKRNWTDPKKGHQLSAKFTFCLYPGAQVRFPHSAWVDLLPEGGQGKVGPKVLGEITKRPSLSAPKVPAARIVKLHMIPHPTRRGQFITAMTANNLAASAGGTGKGLDLVTGTYDAVKDTLTTDLNAAGLNTTGSEMGMSLHHTGLMATWRVFGKGVYVATRPSLDKPFTSAGLVAETLSFSDPVLASFGDSLQLIWADLRFGALLMGELDLGAMSVGDPLPIVGPARDGSKANSPNPIVDADGQLIGVSYFDRLGRDNDHYIALDLDITTDPVLAFDFSSWNVGGAYAGGRFFYVDTGAVVSLDTCWWTGGQGAFGTHVPVTVYAPPGGSYYSYYFGSLAFLPTPLPIPGIGDLGVMPDLLLPIGPHDPLTGAATTVLPIPPDPSLQGLQLATQAMTVDLKAVSLVLDNTATIRIH